MTLTELLMPHSVRNLTDPVATSLSGTRNDSRSHGIANDSNLPIVLCFYMHSLIQYVLLYECYGKKKIVLVMLKSVFSFVHKLYEKGPEVNVEVPQSCIVSISQQGATPLVPKISLIACKLMKKMTLPLT